MSDVAINLSLSNNFILTIPELPIVTEMAQGIVIPSISVVGVEIYNRWVEVRHAGEKIQYTEVDIDFLIDEQWDSYTEIFNWFSKMTGTSHHREETRKLIMRDMSVIILNNARNPIKKLTFIDSFPTSLGAISLNAGSSDELQGILTMSYTEMTITEPDNDTTGITRHSYATDPT